MDNTTGSRQRAESFDSSAPSELALDLQDLGGHNTTFLQEHLISGVSWPERFALLHSALESTLFQQEHVDAEIADAWQRITESGGKLRIASLAQRYNWSRHRLWHRFTDQIGVSPKRVAKIARFDRAIIAIHSGKQLSRVAFECGYADQAHMSREIKELSGRSPTAIAADSMGQAYNSLAVIPD